MADKRISEFAAATAAAAADLLVLVQGGVNKKITIANLFAAVNTAFNFNTGSADLDAVFKGMTDANLFHTDASTDRIGVGTATPAQKLDVNGSLGTNGIHVHKSVDTLSAAGAVSIVTRTTVLDTASAFSATLANGTAGQTKQLMAKNTGTVTLTATTPAGWTQIVFNGIGQSAILEWQDGKWYVTSVRGATLS